MNGRIATVLKWGLIVIFVLVLGYSMVRGTGSAMMPPGPVEGMDGDTRENTLDILKNTANIDSLTGKVDDLKDVKKDLSEINEKLNGNSDRIAALTQQMIESKTSGTESITDLA